MAAEGPHVVTRRTVRATSASGVLDAIADPAARARALEASGLAAADLTDPDRLLGIDAVMALSEAGAREAGDDCFGLHAGERWELHGLGVLSYAVLNAPNVGTGLRNLARFGRFHLQSGGIGLELRGREAWLTYEIAGLPPDRCRQHVEAALTVALRLIRRLANASWRPIRVEFAHAAPRSCAEHERVFGAKVAFGQPTAALVLAAADLERAVPGADRSLLPVVERHLDEVLAAQAGDAFVQRVRSTIAESLCDGAPSLQTLAKGMGLSARTLQRRLDEHELVFRDLVAEIRQELARRYLAERDTNLTEIAFLLGYSELSAFDRAFRRWTGATPLAMRRKLRASNADR
jgi:AraC-like DNA-binding protein